MAANRVIAFKEENTTYFLKGIEISYNEDKGSNFIIDKTEIFNEANLFTKGQESSIIKKLESSGYTCIMAIKPKEQAYHVVLNISMVTPDSFNLLERGDDEIIVDFNVMKEETNIKTEIKYVNPNHNIKFNNVNDCLGRFHFKDKDDAKIFISEHKEEILSIIKNSITYNIR